MRRKVAATSEDDFFVTDEAAETCADMVPSCTRVGDFLLDGGANDGMPMVPDGTTFREILGVVSGFRNLYSLEPRSDADLIRM
jgi:hypothetical protein